MTQSGSGNPAGQFCVGNWIWDTAQKKWVWCGNCGPGILGDPFSGYHVVPVPPLPPGTPNPPSVPTQPGQPPQPGGPTVGKNTGSTKPRQPTPGAEIKPRNPITQDPQEGECGNPVDYDDATASQARLKLDDWAKLPETWQEVNVPAMASLTPEVDGTDPFVYKNQPFLRFLNGKLMVRRPGVSSAARVLLPYNVKPHVALVFNRDEIPDSVATLAYIIGAGQNPVSGIDLNGIFGIGLAHPTALDFVAAGWKLKLDFTNDADNPDACWIPVDADGVEVTTGEMQIKADFAVNGDLTANVQKAFYEQFRARALTQSDFMGSTSLAEGVIVVPGGGGGAGIISAAGFDKTDHPGVYRMSTGTNPAGRVFIIGSPGNGFHYGTDGITRIGAIVHIGTLSTPTQRYMARSGSFSIVLPNTILEGIGIEYTDNENGGRWQGLSVATAEESVDLGITVTADTWYVLEVETNAAGTSIEYFIDGVSVGTLTPAAANIPTGTGFDNFVSIHPMKLVGTTPIVFTADAYYFYKEPSR